HRTEFTYNQQTGRKIAEKNSKGHFKRYQYNTTGQITAVWGDGTYPVKYTYDSHDRMQTMTTYRTDTILNEETFPENLQGDTTTWHYDETTGLLTAKEDAKGNKTTYTYTEAGKLKTRTWARKDNTQPLTTTYIYDEETGELKTTDYSDTTPDINFTYTRTGQQKQITDGTGTRIFKYNSSLQTKQEITDNYTMTRNHEETGIKGRDRGFTLNSEYTISYGFDTKGRLNTIDYNTAGKSDKITYTYLTDSNLLSSKVFLTGFRTDYAYEEKRDLQTKIENAIEGKNISTYQYEYDSISRRTSSLTTGLAFETNKGFNKYGYNTRDEVTESKRYEGTDPDNITTPVEPEKRLYNYDNTGNRKTAATGADQETYTSNELNQYTEISSASLFFDEDGNLTKDNKNRIYTYNCENRLISIQPETPSQDSVKLNFIYDYLGRRVKKTVYSYASVAWDAGTTTLFVYDGWNLILELNEAGVTQKDYVWGLDLSQSLQGAGGIGGLVAAVDGGTQYVYFYDGNG
ncbi:MAG: hypothetical protein EOM16_09230, partial [Bacteroidia bacterium]|nr:hypothetical protein [Bacteroidia bacterium]